MLNRSSFLTLTACVFLVRGATAAQDAAALDSSGPDPVRPTAQHAPTYSERVTTSEAPNSFSPDRRLLLPGFALDSFSTSPSRLHLIEMPLLAGSSRSHKGRNALIGGLIGGATGIIVCTAISNIAKDPGTGFSSCDTKAYVGFALGGIALGALIGWVI